MLSSRFIFFALFPTMIYCANPRIRSSFPWGNSSDNYQVSNMRTGIATGASAKVFSTGCFSSTLALSTSSAEVTKTHDVIVGDQGDLRFDPNEIDANVGDVIAFNFLAINHTLTQSSLLNPCTNSSGFDTGFRQFNPKNETGRYVVDYRVETLDPQWFFCAQAIPKSHCKAGMVFALNAGDKMSVFLAAATSSLPYPTTTSSGVIETITTPESTVTSSFESLSLGQSSSTIPSPTPSNQSSVSQFTHTTATPTTTPTTMPTTTPTASASGSLTGETSAIAPTETPISASSRAMEFDEILLSITLCLVLMFSFFGL